MVEEGQDDMFDHIHPDASALFTLLKSLEKPVEQGLGLILIVLFHKITNLSHLFLLLAFFFFFFSALDILCVSGTAVSPGLRREVEIKNYATDKEKEKEKAKEKAEKEREEARRPQPFQMKFFVKLLLTVVGREMGHSLSVRYLILWRMMLPSLCSKFNDKAFLLDSVKIMVKNLFGQGLDSTE